MNKTTKTIFSGAFALLVGLAANMALAAEGDNFVDEASAKGIAEIETAKMALEKGTSEDVKQFAQKMIDDHTKANQQLAQLAQQKDLEMSDEATLMDKAKAMILKLRDGENFDKAYANKPGRRPRANHRAVSGLRRERRERRSETVRSADAAQTGRTPDARQGAAGQARRAQLTRQTRCPPCRHRVTPAPEAANR